MFRGLKSLHGEKGAIMYVVIALSFGLLLFAPVFIDYASLHYTRRAAQKAADAAALAAAVEYANLLSIDTGRHWVVTTLTYLACCCVKKKGPCEVGIYMGTMFIGGQLWMWMTGSAEAKAQQYAELNGSKMTAYTSPFVLYFFPKIKVVERIPVLPVPVRVEVERDVPMIYEALYGGKFKVTARATAEAYLYKVEKGSGILGIDGWLPCYIPPKKVGYFKTFKFKWKVRLVE